MGLTNAERQRRWRLSHQTQNQPTFYKMKVVGPRCAELITEPLQAMRELNPNLNAMLHSTEQMNKILCESSKQPLKKRRKIASSAVALHDAHLQRLKAFKSDAYNIYDPLAQAFAQQQPAQEEAPPAQEEAPPAHVEEEVEEDESSLGSRAAMERVMADIPQKFHTNFAKLGRYLQANPDLIRITQAGRPIVAGQELGRANISDIMRSLYVWPKSQALPSGVKEVIEALHSAGAPSYLLSNAAVRTMYQRLQEPSEHPHAETQTEPEELEQEEEYGEEVAKKSGREEETSQFHTPQHSVVRPQPTFLKVEEHAPARSMKPETKKISGVPAKPEASKASRIPAMSTKPVPSKASTSQKGEGRRGEAEFVRLSGKQPTRVLRVPRIATPVKSTMKASSKARSIPAKYASSNASVGWMEQGHKVNTEDVRLPGKPIRWLYLY